MSEVKVTIEEKDRKALTDDLISLAEELVVKMNDSAELKVEVAEIFLEYLFSIYDTSKGSDSMLANKMGKWLEAYGMTPEQVISDYKDNIVIEIEGDEVSIVASSPQWEVVARAMEFGTRLSPPIPHWNLALDTFSSLMGKKITEEMWDYIDEVTG